MDDGLPLPTEALQDTFADFLTRAVSPEANSLVDDLTRHAVAWEADRKRSDNQRASMRGPYKRGEKGLKNLREGIGRFVGNLLRAKADPRRTGKVFRSLKKDTFTGAPVSLNTFEVVWKALEARELSYALRERSAGTQPASTINRYSCQAPLRSSSRHTSSSTWHRSIESLWRALTAISCATVVSCSYGPTASGNGHPSQTTMLVTRQGRSADTA